MKPCGTASKLTTDFHHFDNQLWLVLAPDFTAEHEHGIQQLQQDFQINQEHTISHDPGVIFQQDENQARLHYDSYNPGEYHEERKRGSQHVQGAWSESGFSVSVQGREHVAHLMAVATAIQNHTAKLALVKNGDNPYQNPALAFIVPMDSNA